MKFKEGMNQHQEFLFAKKPCDFLPKDHLSKAIYEVIDNVDLSKIESKYSELGQKAFNPKMMVRLLFNGYSVKVRSSRKISKACEERVDFIYLADGLKPSHDRISDFRKDNLEELKLIFIDIVLIAADLGLVKLNNIKTSIDGTKIRANASAKLSKDEEGLQKLLNKTQNEINNWFEEAEKLDAQEDTIYGKENRGDELPKHLRSKKARKKAIEKAINKLNKQKGKIKEKIKKEKKRDPTQKELIKIEKTKINITDNDAKFMKERCGVIKPNYNAQISVDEKKQLILANDVVAECNDQHQFVSMLKQTKENTGRSPKQAKADNGYHPQLEEAAKLFPEIDLYVDDKNRRKDYINFYELKQKYSKEEYANLIKIVSPEGEKEYKKRMHTVEPPFGNIKFNLGYRNFYLRGLTGVKGEFNLMCIAHNLKKIVSFLKKSGTDLAVALKNVKKTARIKVNLGLNMDY